MSIIIKRPNTAVFAGKTVAGSKGNGVSLNSSINITSQNKLKTNQKTTRPVGSETQSTGNTKATSSSELKNSELIRNLDKSTDKQKFQAVKVSAELAGKEKTEDNEPVYIQKKLHEQSTINMADKSKGYSTLLSESRMKAKDTALQVKKMRYDFKSISSQLMRSKTSVNARQIASKARRIVQKLKKELNMKDCDKEEIQIEIEHAKAMERVAKKKAKHLEEEEMLKSTGGICAADIEEDKKVLEDETPQIDESESSLLTDDEALNCMGAMYGNTDSILNRANAEYGNTEYGLGNMDTTYETSVIENVDALYENTDALYENMDELYEEMNEAMADLLSEMGLSDLADSLEGLGREEDPEDLKMLKIKHRNEEQKAIVHADAKYLKAIFEKMNREIKMAGINISKGAGNRGILNAVTSNVTVPNLATHATNTSQISVSPVPDMTAGVSSEGVEVLDILV